LGNRPGVAALRSYHRFNLFRLPERGVKWLVKNPILNPMTDLTSFRTL
jgi:hypothetical protein